MTQPEIDFEKYVPALINALERRLAAASASVFRERLGLGLIEWRILALLNAESGLSAQRVSNIVGLDKAPVSRALRTLESKGCLTISMAAKGRRHSLVITPAGKALFRTSLPLAIAREERLLQDFSRAERLVLIESLRRLIARAPAAAAPPRAAAPRKQPTGSRVRAR